MGRAVLSIFVIAALASGTVPVVSADAPYRVIVNPSVKGSQIPRSALSSIFLKQAVRWGDGSTAVPVDQSVRSAVRSEFTGEVLKQGLVEVQIYWQRQMAKGQVPPQVKTSDEEIVAFVASTPGAIGYVSPATPLPDSVRVIAVIN